MYNVRHPTVVGAVRRGQLSSKEVSENGLKTISETAVSIPHSNRLVSFGRSSMGIRNEPPTLLNKGATAIARCLVSTFNPQRSKSHGVPKALCTRS